MLLMQSRWHYVSDKAIILNHPLFGVPMLVMRNGLLPEVERERVLRLNKMRVKGGLQEREGIRYYELEECDYEDGS
jgi:hypothetical protein